tara:strand:+ start:1664 stop:2095 length:432 start_codon:yes stop_codon:yes gene_type:complete
MVKRQIRIKVKGTWHTVELEEPQKYPFQMVVDGETMAIEVQSGKIDHSPQNENSNLLKQDNATPGMSAITQEDQKIIRSPMPGRIVSITAEVWDKLEAGAEVCVLETMKMEQSIKISNGGIVRAIFVESGQNVTAGTPLVQLG